MPLRTFDFVTDGEYLIKMRFTTYCFKLRRPNCSLSVISAKANSTLFQATNGRYAGCGYKLQPKELLMTGLRGALQAYNTPILQTEASQGF